MHNQEAVIQTASFYFSKPVKIHFYALSLVAVGALKLRDVTEIQWMFECLIAFVTGGTLPGVLVAEIDRMLE
jgi:hypothetical protein